jgi:hypothetical protein
MFETVLNFGHLIFGFVSDFVLRISKFILRCQNRPAFLQRSYRTKDEGLLFEDFGGLLDILRAKNKQAFLIRRGNRAVDVINIDPLLAEF